MLKFLLYLGLFVPTVLAGSLEVERSEPLIIPRPELMLTTSEDKPVLLPPDLSLALISQDKAKILQIDQALQALKNMQFSPPINSVAPSNPHHIAVTFTPLATDGYQLLIQQESPEISINTSSYTGLFYALQTLTAILKQNETPLGYTLPSLCIADKPLFPWRGLHLDVSRHFFSLEDIKRLLDTMGLMKLNKLHLHLSDGPGWRIEIKRYPELTSRGAWRVDKRDRIWDWGNTEIPKQDDERSKYGGFYSQEEMRELIRYAKTLGITIIPEIDIPGHSYAAMISYPDLSCSGTPEDSWLHGRDVICVGKDSSTQFFINVFKELDAIFPKSTPFHIGGDEVDKTSWLQCKHCKARMKKQKLKTGKQLQSAFIQDIVTAIKKTNREAIVWDEAFDEGMQEDATVMVWREEAIAKKSAEAGKKTILALSSHFYLDYYQCPKETEPPAIGGDINLDKIYNYPLLIDQLKPEFRKNIQGLQANIWTEYMQTMDQVEYMAWPRGCALAERAWSSANPDTEKFKKRLAPYLQMMEKKDTKFHPLLKTTP